MLASSSAGNSVFLGTDHTRILIDAGLSRKETLRRLADIGEDPRELNAILVTHEHTDHIAGLPLLSKTLDVTVYATELTAPSIITSDFSGRVQTFQAGTGFEIGDLRVDSFTIPHDAVDPVGYCIRHGGRKVGIVTDLGYLPESVKYHVRGCDLLMLESNHDLEMLKVGPYPWSIKQRVMGRKGHLSNDVVSDFIYEELDGVTHTLVLGHLSEHNNHPELVRLAASQALERKALSTRLVVAKPRLQSELIEF